MAVDLGSTFKELIDEINSKSVIDSIDGLKGGTLSSPLKLTGGDAATASKMTMSPTGKGQVTDESTSTLLGFMSGDTFTVGSNSYATNIRGNANSAIGGKKFSDLATKGDLSDIQAAVAGKARSYILSYDDKFSNGRTGAKWYDKDGNDITSSIGSGNYVDSNCNNSTFNDAISSLKMIVPSDNTYLIFRLSNDNTASLGGYDYLVCSTKYINTTFNIGDNIYIIETAVPDRWFGGNSIYYALEGKPLANYAVKDANNTFTGTNQHKQTEYFYKGITASNDSNLSDVATYKYDRIVRGSYELLFPSKSGTLAVVEDIPSTDNFVTTDTEQTITGKKTFDAPANVAGTEQITALFKTSNGGTVAIGKEAANSGTMIRLEQEAGKTRLRFRASTTAGAIVWEQPEKAAKLYFDLGNDAGSGVNRVQIRNKAGVLALTNELPAAVSANPALTGSEATLTALQVGNTKYKIQFDGGSCVLDDLEADYTDDVNAVPVLDVEDTGNWIMVPVSELGGGGSGSVSKIYLHKVVLTTTTMVNNNYWKFFVSIVSTNSSVIKVGSLGALTSYSYQICAAEASSSSTFGTTQKYAAYLAYANLFTIRFDIANGSTQYYVSLSPSSYTISDSVSEI